MLTSRRRWAALAVALAALCAGVPAAPGVAQTAACVPPGSGEEPDGPTDMTAATGNGRLSVGLNGAATVTVLKWPTPSFYDQIKHTTTDRGAPLFGAKPNEGAFFGLAYRRAGDREWDFTWLRDLPARQRFADDDGDEVVTRFRADRPGLTVSVHDVVAARDAILYRRVTVQRDRSSRVQRVRVIAFANFNPVFSKTPNSPTDDWCTEEDNDDGGVYLTKADAVLHERAGTDASTGDPSGAALVMGFDSASSGHSVGEDTYETGATGASAYDDATDGRLSGDEQANGQADAALSADLRLPDTRARSATVIVASAFSRREALGVLARARRTSAAGAARAKARWWRDWLRTTVLPRRAPGPITALAKRALITARQNTARSGLMVASIATQPPLGLDWIRDGAYLNRMLDVSGKHAMVARHNREYARLQARAGDTPTGGETTPPGNWSQNFYADGVVGGPIPYEIDETGLGIYTLWDHYTFRPDRNYLLAVYPAIQRAAHYLSDNQPLGCRDPATGLHCPAPEGDDPEPRQTLVGAQAAWLGLDAAARAARVVGTDTAKDNARKWTARRDELGAAIEANFLDESCSCYTRDHETGGTNLFPVGLEPYGSDVSAAQARVNMRYLERAMAGKIARGRHESKTVLGNAYEWAGNKRKLGALRQALRWIAAVPTTAGTGVLGGRWMRYPDPNDAVVTMDGAPHAPAQAIFYLAALKVFGRARWAP